MDAVAIGFLVWFKDFERFCPSPLSTSHTDSRTAQNFMHNILTDSSFYFILSGSVTIRLRLLCNLFRQNTPVTNSVVLPQAFQI
jgi:hypothetical protein